MSTGFISLSSSSRREGVCFCAGHGGPVCVPHRCKRHRVDIPGMSVQHQQCCCRGRSLVQAMEPSTPGPGHTVAVLLEGLGALRPRWGTSSHVAEGSLGMSCQCWSLLQLWVTLLLSSHPAITPFGRGLPTKVCPMISFSSVLSVTWDSLGDACECLMPERVGFPWLGLSSR